MKKKNEVQACPVCTSTEHEVTPHLRLLNVRCRGCGWYYTQKAERG